jgi:putative transcriptional regulator
MPIIINLDVMLAKKKKKSKDLAEAIGITEQNLSILKTGKAKAVRLSTLEAICRELGCQPGELFTYEEENSTTYECDPIQILSYTELLPINN